MQHLLVTYVFFFIKITQKITLMVPNNPEKQNKLFSLNSQSDFECQSRSLSSQSQKKKKKPANTLEIIHVPAKENLINGLHASSEATITPLRQIQWHIYMSK